MPRESPPPEPYDNRARVAAEAAAARAEAAYQWEHVPPVVREHLARPVPVAAPPLEQYLAALDITRPFRGPPLPPAELAAGYDEQLAGLITEADQTASHALSVALLWQNAEPGAPAFGQMLATGDDEQIIDYLTVGRHRAWLDAWHAQQAAHVAEANARAYARAATDLHERLTGQMAELIDTIGPMFEKVGKSDRRAYDRAWDLVAEWRKPAELLAWCRNPHVAFVVYGAHVLPPEVVWREYEAHGRATGTPRMIDIPIDALDAPRRPRVTDTLPMNGTAVIRENETVISSPHHRGIFRRGA